MKKDNLNFVFFGTPEVASETLEILKAVGFSPSLVITAPDKPQGRKMLLTPPPVKVWAEKNKIPYIQPKEKTELLSIFSSEEFGLAVRSEKKLKEVRFDLFIVVAYGKIISEDILNLPKFGSLNVHYSLLPKYRGASPVESAILNGETETGVTIQKMVYRMDAGDILTQEKINILPEETAPELRQRLTKLGGELLVKILDTPSASGTSPYIGGGWVGVKQDESQATVCKKIKKEDGLIDLNDDGKKNYNKFRAYAHWPRTYFFSAKGGSALGGQNGKRIIITKAHLENGKFVIDKIIPESGKEMDWID